MVPQLWLRQVSGQLVIHYLLLNQVHGGHRPLVINALRGGHMHILTPWGKQFQETRLMPGLIILLLKVVKHFKELRLIVYSKK